MIGPTGAVRVMVATKPVDFRKGAEGLATLVREAMRADPFSGAVYVFRAKRADRIKLIFWDGTGLCLFAKRLEHGIFRWPKIEDGVMRLSAAQLSAGEFCAEPQLKGIDQRPAFLCLLRRLKDISTNYLFGDRASAGSRTRLSSAASHLASRWHNVSSGPISMHGPEKWLRNILKASPRLIFLLIWVEKNVVVGSMNTMPADETTGQ
jgi:transposase